MASPKISLHGVTKAFGPKKVLQGIDLEIGAGESMVVIGGSGTGKSVLLKCILGLMEPNAGSIQVDGEETTDLGRHERARVMRKFGVLFQGGALFDSLRVWENVAFGPIQSDGMPVDEAREVAAAKLGAVGLGPEIGELFPSELSGGKQKRVAHARASARKIGHRVGMLHEGKLIWQGPVGEIDRSGNAHVDQFIHGRAEGPIRMQVRKL